MNEQLIYQQSKQQTGWLGKLLFWQILPLLKQSQKIIIGQDNIYDVTFEEETLTLYSQFCKHHKNQNLKMALLKTFKSKIIICWIITIMLSFCQLAVPLAIKEIVEYIQIGEYNIERAIYIIVQIVVLRILSLFCQVHSRYLLDKIGFDATSVLKMELFQKSMRVSFQSNTKFSQGEVINIMQVDASKIQDSTNDIAYSASFPLSAIIGFYLLYRFIGLAFLGGLAGLAIVAFLNYILAKLLSEYQDQIMKCKDKRTKATNEIFTQIKFIKINSFEEIFIEKLQKLREEELRWLNKKTIVKACQVYCGWFCPMLIQITTFAAYIFMGNNLTPSTTFAVIGLFSVLEEPILYLPNCITNLIQTYISVERCAAYLNTQEVNPNNFAIKEFISEGDNYSIQMNHANFSWYNQYNMINKQNSPAQQYQVQDSQIEDSFLQGQESEQQVEYQLKDISINFKPGQFVAIIGDVGSGKSSLLLCLLQEMIAQGDFKITINGSIAYLGQKPWIQNASVKDNILFGLDYSEQRYNDAIKYACLREDLKILNNGDSTIIGEKGVNVSGGQKARIGLARAIYSNSDIYLLDDPISAVDTHVGESIIKDCLLGYLKNKTRLLVTHSIINSQYADHIILIEKGQIVEEGSYQEMSQKPLFSKLLQNYSDEALDEIELEKQPSLQKRKSSLIINQPEKQSQMIEEDREEGEIDSTVLEGFKDANRGYKYLILVACITSCQIATLFVSSVWIANWSEKDDSVDNKHYLNIYIYLGVGQGLFGFFRNFVLGRMNVYASGTVHYKMLRILYSSLSKYFERVPLGRILNRFTKDLDSIDSNVYNDFSYLYIISFLVIYDVVISVYSSSWIIIIPVLIFFYTSFVTRSYFMRASRELFRLEAISLSPIVSYFSEVINGVTVIRSFNKQNYFIYEQAKRQDINRKIFYSKLTSQGWFQLILGLQSYLVSVTGLIFCVFYGQEHPAKAGLLLVYGAFLDKDIAEAIQQLSVTENGLISFERCFAFQNQADIEQLNGSKFIMNWPDKGKIEFKDYSVRYRSELPFALKNLNFTIEQNDKIGVVGRTGAGKSTITMALLRILDDYQGQIIIDGADIKELGLKSIRQQITMIMQEATIFEGSLKENLDPLNLNTEQDIKQICQQCCLNYDINFQLQENGNNLSQGEKQLVSIARAVLKKSKIVLIDEATANIDIETEKQIQQTIQSVFKECTVITIAHRINTIMHCNKVIVVDKGEIAEYDETEKLLQNKNSLFFRIYQDAMNLNK